jgi:PAS domain S-box-containing protein
MNWYIIGVSLILAAALLIFETLWLRAKHKRMERELVITNERLRLSLESGASVGWDWDLKTGQDRWFGDLQMMFGIPSDTFEGRVEDFHKRVYPEDRELIGKAVADAKRSRKPYAAEFRVVRTDGSVRWISARGMFYYGANGDAERMLGIAGDITERKQTDEALKKSEEKFSIAFRRSPLALAITRTQDNRYVDVNEAFEHFSGWKRAEVIGRTTFDIGLWVDPGQRAAYRENLLSGNVVLNREFRIRMKNGEVRTGLGSAELIEIDGEPCVLAVTADITDLKRAEATLRESEERFRLVANTAPVMIWMSGVDKLCTYFNEPWLDFTGRSLEAEMGNGWVEGVHLEDLKESLDARTTAFDKRAPFRLEYRLRRHDGEYRWLIDSGVPRFNADGSFAGYIGSAMDVTERKWAEEALSMVSRRLIEAHEEERSRLARELHDDILQRLSLLIMNLEHLRRGEGTSMTEVAEGIGKAIQHASSLGRDMQGLSHRLHSSKLEFLGLATAAASYCSELSDQHKMQIDLHSENIPKDVSREISLCIFRVLQEAVQNAIKHSGSQRVQVLLNCRSSAIYLTVRDSGIGFDPNEAIKGRGLGLISMKERIKLVGGGLSIESQPQTGTTIHARVPVVTRTRSAHLAG